MRYVLVMLLSLGSAVMDQHTSSLDPVRSSLTLVLTPVELIAGVPHEIRKLLSNFSTSSAELRSANDALRGENLQLKARLQKYEALETENMRLRDLLDSSLRLGERVLIAELTDIDLDPYRHQVVINKGTTSGVFPGQSVLDASGVMGQVTRVGQYSATVLLITDPAHALPVQIIRNGLRSIAVGTGLTDRLELLHLPNNADVREGDVITTSGLGGRFPAGYPVAMVSRITEQSGQPFLQVWAKPIAPIEQVREVLLVWSIDRSTRTSEKRGQP